MVVLFEATKWPHITSDHNRLGNIRTIYSERHHQLALIVQEHLGFKLHMKSLETPISCLQFLKLTVRSKFMKMVIIIWVEMTQES